MSVHPICRSIYLIGLLVLTACNSGGTISSNDGNSASNDGNSASNDGKVGLSAATMRIFSDNAGVAEITRSDGVKIYYITKNVRNEVDDINRIGETTSIDLNQYPITERIGNYNLRTGVLGNDNLFIVQALGDKGSSILYTWNNSGNSLMAGNEKLNGTPIGTFNYTGLYQVVGRNSISLNQLGDASLDVDFNSGSFTINATSNDSSLKGSGFVELATGRIAATELQLNVLGTTYSTNTLGRLHGENASKLTGVFHTQQSDPDFMGAYAASR